MSKNSGNRTGKPRAPGAGRPVAKATIKQGAGLFITQVYPDGTADLGRGKVEVEAHGRDRLIKVKQEDGSEIRILIISG